METVSVCVVIVEWYKTCVNAIERYRKESTLNDDKMLQAEKEQYKRQLESELKDLDQADIGGASSGFLRHLYKTYPPKNPAHKLDENNIKDPGDSKKQKQALLMAIQHYHPDKQDTEKFGKKWTVFCEEITKRLNRRYECVKF